METSSKRLSALLFFVFAISGPAAAHAPAPLLVRPFAGHIHGIRPPFVRSPFFEARLNRLRAAGLRGFDFRLHRRGGFALLWPDTWPYGAPYSFPYAEQTPPLPDFPIEAPPGAAASPDIETMQPDIIAAPAYVTAQIGPIAAGPQIIRVRPVRNRLRPAPVVFYGAQQVDRAY
jgi:hypothetical protein